MGNYFLNTQYEYIFFFYFELKSDTESEPDTRKFFSDPHPCLKFYYLLFVSRLKENEVRNIRIQGTLMQGWGSGFGLENGSGALYLKQIEISKSVLNVYIR